jgi:hypothetical protein
MIHLESDSGSDFPEQSRKDKRVTIVYHPVEVPHTVVALVDVTLKGAGIDDLIKRQTSRYSNNFGALDFCAIQTHRMSIVE